MGEMLKEMPKNKGMNGKVFTGNIMQPVKDTTPTLKDIGIEKHESAIVSGTNRGTTQLHDVTASSTFKQVELHNVTPPTLKDIGIEKHESARFSAVTRCNHRKALKNKTQEELKNIFLNLSNSAFFSGLLIISA